MHPSIFAKSNPSKPALIMAATGQVISYAELEQRSNQGAHLLRSLGLQIGDAIAVMLPNHSVVFDIAWAAQRSGLYLTMVSTHLKSQEIAYIIKDSGAKAIITTAELAAAAGIAKSQLGDVARLMVGEVLEGWSDWEAASAAMPGTPIADERAGSDMLYSSGTTGQPKGIKLQLPADGDIKAPSKLVNIARDAFGFGENTTYLSPAPLYHAAPLRWSMAVHRLGGTVVVMNKFDAEGSLSAIATYKVTHSQWVPTHFVRMFKLPEQVRKSYDVSSLRIAIHAAAPCPVPVKLAMFDWWGPILVEYYAGTEGNGMTMIGPRDWLTHQGSVGKPVGVGKVHILDDSGQEVPPRVAGNIYFEGGDPFEYHNDPDKTAQVRDVQGWSTLGDIGWVDEEGFLYLTDRKSFMIISGGVNIYPQEIENLIVTHPKVTDVAVIGVPDAEMGERVVAIVQPKDWADATPDFATQLKEWIRERLSGVKTPRQIDFRQELPRQDNGKLYKRLLVDEYSALNAV